jgi:hypothetical protein
VSLGKHIRGGWASCIVKLSNEAGSAAARSHAVEIHHR